MHAANYFQNDFAVKNHFFREKFTQKCLKSLKKAGESLKFLKIFVKPKIDLNQSNAKNLN